MLHGVLQHIGHIPRSLGTDSCNRILGVVEHRLLPVIHHSGHFGIGAGFPVYTAIGVGGISRRHILNGDTVGQTTHGQGCQVDVGIRFAADDLLFHQRIHTQLLHGKLIAVGRRQICQNFDSHRIGGHTDGGTNGH